ncbi:uncharacterized protein LOC143649594 [Tamandua tetradactyla]|uniref:uncharacterized protein LOC143649594 n=1 Tax=Tamandua tetradactyla TaxID=48850 RepID=UPI0040537CCA
MVYKQLRSFISGGMVNCSLANITKMTRGHLRPHFLAVCQPDTTSFNHDSGFISNYTCTGDPAEVLEAWLVLEASQGPARLETPHAVFQGAVPTCSLPRSTYRLATADARPSSYGPQYSPFSWPWHCVPATSAPWITGITPTTWLSDSCRASWWPSGRLSISPASLALKRSCTARSQQLQVLDSDPLLSSPCLLPLTAESSPAEHQDAQRMS